MRECFSRRRDFVVKRLSPWKGVRLVPPRERSRVPGRERADSPRRETGVRDSAGSQQFLIDEAKIVCVPGSAFGMEGHPRISMHRRRRDRRRPESAQSALDRM